MRKKLGKTVHQKPISCLIHECWPQISSENGTSYIRLPRMKGFPQSTLAILLSNVMKLILILLVGFSCLTFINAMPMCKWLISVFKSEFNNLFSVFSGFVAPDNNIEDNQDLFENFWKRTQMKKMFSPFSRMAANVISGLTSSGSSNLKLICLP